MTDYDWKRDLGVGEDSHGTFITEKQRNDLAAHIEKLEAERDKAEEWGAAEAKLRYEWQQIARVLADELERSGYMVVLPRDHGKFSQLHADEWITWAREQVKP